MAIKTMRLTAESSTIKPRLPRSPARMFSVGSASASIPTSALSNHSPNGISSLTGTVRERMQVVPTPTSERTTKLPPNCSAISLDIGSPVGRSIPLCLDSWAAQIGTLPIDSITSADIPDPWSVTMKSIATDIITTNTIAKLACQRST